jgi:hypothetical protein
MVNKQVVLHAGGTSFIKIVFAEVVQMAVRVQFIRMDLYDDDDNNNNKYDDDDIHWYI